MSYDLMVFDKTRAPNNFEDFLAWQATQTQWDEKRDYNDIIGTAAPLVSWFMAMKATFPALNGPHSLPDEEAFDNDSIEKHLTDYSIGSAIIYAGFAWSVAQEAFDTALSLAQQHGVGLFNPQTGDIFCDGMITCQMRDETGNESTVFWEKLKRTLQSLPERAGAFVTIWFTNNGTDEEFMQCMAQYPKKSGFFQKLLGKQPTAPATIPYQVEFSTGAQIFAQEVTDLDRVVAIFREYYGSRTLPTGPEWEDTGIL